VTTVSDFDGYLKILLWPEERNQILIRVENIADLFDGAPETTPQFDLLSFATNLYAKANSGSEPQSVSIEERTLTNNDSYQEMESRRYAWKNSDG